MRVCLNLKIRRSSFLMFPDVIRVSIYNCLLVLFHLSVPLVVLRRRCQVIDPMKPAYDSKEFINKLGLVVERQIHPDDVWNDPMFAEHVFYVW